MNTQQTPRVVMSRETHGFLRNELAETIAAEIMATILDNQRSEPLVGILKIAILDRQLDMGPLDKLSKAMFQVKYTYLREDRDPQEWLEDAISEQRSLLKNCQEIVEAEDSKEKYAEILPEMIDEDTEADSYTEAMTKQIENFNARRTNMLSASDSDIRNHFREKKAVFIENLNALGSIAAMTNDDEQSKACADYYVKHWIEHIRVSMLYTASAASKKRDALKAQDIHVIGTDYLYEFHTSELKHLAQIYRLPPVETPTDEFLRLSNERIRRAKIEAEERRVADEDPEKKDRS